MATNISVELPGFAKPHEQAESMSPMTGILWALRPLSSMKLTMALLAMAIFLIFAGTFAQAKAGMWEAISLYFRAWFVWIDPQIFFPDDWFRESAPWVYDVARKVPRIPFFGGATIGTAMMVNLFAAHLVRFRVQVRGTRLLAGLAATAAGCFLTWVVIALGDFQQGLRSEPLVSWQSTALLTLAAAGGASLAMLVGGVWQLAQASQTSDKGRLARGGLMIASAAVALLGCFLLWAFRGDISALRILWQLIQGSVAGMALLGGCWLLFDKRAGIVLLHGGVALMMVSQLMVSWLAKEERMSIEEGETAHYALDIREAELAVVSSTENEDRHTVIPEPLLKQSLAGKDGGKRRIRHADLPFDLEVLRFYPNSDLADVDKGENLATAGAGREVLLVERSVSAGASSDSDADMPAAYVRILEKGSDNELGVYALSTRLLDDHIRVDGRTYDLALRFKRDYKPYHVLLKDVKKEDYPGSDTPRTYESVAQFVDPVRAVDRAVTISMNNPLRYLGETFYQSGYHRDPRTGREATTLQVVTNAGWMTPYVACMIVAVGLLYQFLQTLLRFVISEPQASLRPAALPAFGIAESLKSAGPPDKKKGGGRPDDVSKSYLPEEESWWAWFRPSWLAVAMMALTALVIFGGLLQPTPKSNGFDLYRFGRLPVVDNGRAKPLDSLARETLLSISNKTTFKGADGKSRPAIEWLLMSVADPEAADKLQILRIDNPEVVEALGLEDNREGMRYSLAELRDKSDEYNKQLKQLREKNKDEYTVFDKKFAELSSRIQAHMRVHHAFVPETLPEMPTRAQIDANDPKAFQKAKEVVDLLQNFGAFVEGANPPLAVPVTGESLKSIAKDRLWMPFSVAVMFNEVRSGLMPDDRFKTDKPTAALRDIFVAYAQGNADSFNDRVGDYTEWLEENKPAIDAKTNYNSDRVGAEAMLNHFAPFGWTQGILLYLLAWFTSALGLLMFRRQIGSAAFWMLVLVFVLHTCSLGARIYISGRPPVTNLYSSAVFIGWAAVLIGLVLEGGFRLGVGNLMAAAAGMGSLIIADKLSQSGDTIGVMQAVLDTQFWLATHVVCITTGYAATFAAGIIGIAYILLGVFTPRLEEREGKLMSRMIYGVVCFALLLSFVGTVLGGLWADDSWGRFWGWDPKENGALIIVLWNAFILHARWEKVAKERGMAVLAVLGNVVTSWSWFGTNQLKVGLHSYGFTEGVLWALGITVALHLAIVGIGLLPKSMWWSYREQELGRTRPQLT